MGIEDLAESLDINKFINYMIDGFFNIAKYPFGIWNSLPAWVRLTTYAIILIIAIFLGYITWKYREAWRYYQ